MALPVILPEVGRSQDLLSKDPSGPIETLQVWGRPSKVKRNENLLSFTSRYVNRFCPAAGKHCIDCPTHLPSKEGLACGQAAVAASREQQPARIEIVSFMCGVVRHRCLPCHPIRLGRADKPSRVSFAMPPAYSVL